MIPLIAIHISHGLNILICLVGIVIAYRKFLKYKIPLILYILGFNSSWAFMNFSVIMSDLPNISQSPYNIYWAFAAIILASITYMLFFYFFRFFNKKGSRVIEILMWIGFIALIMLIGIEIKHDIHISTYILEINQGENYIRLIQWSELIYIIIVVTVGPMMIWVLRTLKRGKSQNYNKSKQKQFNRMIMGVYLAFLIGPMFALPGFILRDFQNFQLFIPMFINIISYLLISFGVLYIELAYFAPKKFGFLLPHRLDYVYCIHKSGLTLVKYNFQQINNMKNLRFEGGAVIAITTVINKTFNIQSDVQTIKFPEIEMLFKKKREIYYVLILDSAESYIRRCFTNFIDAFDQLYYTQINDPSPVISINTIKPLIKQNFGI